MDYIKDLTELCNTLSGELADINEKIRSAGGKMSAGDLEVVDKLTHSIKSIKSTISMMEDEEEGYSEFYPWAYADGQGGGGGGSYRGGSRRGGSYRTGRSYARGRGSNQSRDRMGRYSGERGYSRNDLVDQMREMMEDAPDERTRQEMMRLIDKMENT